MRGGINNILLGTSTQQRQLQLQRQQQQHQPHQQGNAIVASHRNNAQSNSVQMQFAALSRDRDLLQKETGIADKNRSVIELQIDGLRTQQKQLMEQLRIAQESLGDVNGKRMDLENEIDRLSKQHEHEKRELENSVLESGKLEAEESKAKKDYYEEMDTQIELYEAILRQIEFTGLSKLACVETAKSFLHHQSQNQIPKKSYNYNDVFSEQNETGEDNNKSTESCHGSYSKLAEITSAFIDSEEKLKKEEDMLNQLSGSVNMYRHNVLQHSSSKESEGSHGVATEEELMELEDSWGNTHSEQLDHIMGDNDDDNNNHCITEHGNGDESNPNNANDHDNDDENLQLFYGGGCDGATENADMQEMYAGSEPLVQHNESDDANQQINMMYHNNEE